MVPADRHLRRGYPSPPRRASGEGARESMWYSPKRKVGFPGREEDERFPEGRAEKALFRERAGSGGWPGAARPRSEAMLTIEITILVNSGIVELSRSGTEPAVVRNLVNRCRRYDVEISHSEFLSTWFGFCEFNICEVFFKVYFCLRKKKE